MKKTSISFLILIISLFFVGQISFVEAGKGIKKTRNNTMWSKVLLGKEDVGILPTSPFYFVKEWSRDIKKFFTFDSVKKTELELKYGDEKLIEMAKMVDENCGESDPEVKSQNGKNQCSQAALEKALNNYLKAQEKLAKRLQSLSKNKNIEELLNKLGERIILHQALFDEIINGAPVLEKVIREGGRTVGAGQITEIIKRVGGFDGTEEEGGIARRNKAELIDAIAKGTKAIEKLPYPEGIKELKALEVLTRIEEQLPEEAKKGIETAKENIEKELVEAGEIQKAAEWEIEQGASGKILVEGVPVETKTLDKVIEKIEEKIKEPSPGSERSNIVNLEAIKELKNELKENSPKSEVDVKSSICPQIVPDSSKGEEECLKAAKVLEERYPGCNFVSVCKGIVEKCGSAPVLPGEWRCIEGKWIDISQCGKIQCLKYDPVCGIDNKTYSCGEADALSCGVKIAYKGECKSTSIKCIPRPACLDETPRRCLMPEPQEGWCPKIKTKITNFEECVKAGYPVAESYPRQCWTPDGKHFVEEIIQRKQNQ